MRDKELPVTRAAIAALIPHQGTMCLLETVTDCTDTEIVCTTTSHAAGDNPLLREGHLAGVHLCEYGAQAMALHGALSGDTGTAGAKPGLLVALRDVRLAVAVVGPQGTLKIRARQIHASATGFQYEFVVTRESRLLASGRATVLFDKDSKGTSD